MGAAKRPASSPGEPAWPRSRLPGSSPCSGELFPLPRIPSLGIDCTGSRSSRRRAARRDEVLEASNGAVDALNHLYGMTARSDGPMTAAHQSVHHRILARVADIKPNFFPDPREAFQKLLGNSESEYLSEGSTVRPYVESQLKLAGCSSPIPVEQLMAPAARDVLEPSVLLESEGVRSQRERDDPVVPYTDVVLRGDGKARLQFLRRLVDSGIMGACRVQKARVTPFFVKKKADAIRLVWDCRGAHRYFKPPPPVELGAAECAQRIELGVDETLFMAQADVQNCFYQISLPLWMTPYFAWDRISAREALEVGLTAYVDGTPVKLTDGYVYPCLQVLPMGFSWSFWVVQHVHEHIAHHSGFPATQCLVGSWPAPPLQNGPIALPYCDNVTVIGTDPTAVEVGLTRLLAGFERAGFSMHEITPAESDATFLGSRCDGNAGTVAGKTEKIWDLRGAFLYLAARPMVTGREIEILLGQFIPIGLFARGLLSVPRALYSFIKDSYMKPQVLWKSAALESSTLAGLLPLAGANIRRRWNTTVYCSDAADHGFGGCHKIVPVEDVAMCGSWQERWRFRRLPPEEWKPRTRALDPDAVRSLPRVVDGEYLSDVHAEWVKRSGFPEVGQVFVDPAGWEESFSQRLVFEEHITLKEGRAFLKQFRRAVVDVSQHDSRTLFLVDNMGLALSISKGRATDYCLLQICRRAAALSLASGIHPALRWIPSELNVSDEPSRRFEGPSATSAGDGWVRGEIGARGPPGLCEPAAWRSAYEEYVSEQILRGGLQPEAPRRGKCFRRWEQAAQERQARREGLSCVQAREGPADKRTTVPVGPPDRLRGAHGQELEPLRLRQLLRGVPTVVRSVPASRASRERQTRDRPDRLPRHSPRGEETPGRRAEGGGSGPPSLPQVLGQGPDPATAGSEGSGGLQEGATPAVSPAPARGDAGRHPLRRRGPCELPEHRPAHRDPLLQLPQARRVRQPQDRRLETPGLRTKSWTAPLDAEPGRLRLGQAVQDPDLRRRGALRPSQLAGPCARAAGCWSCTDAAAVRRLARPAARGLEPGDAAASPPADGALPVPPRRRQRGHAGTTPLPARGDVPRPLASSEQRAPLREGGADPEVPGHGPAAHTPILPVGADEPRALHDGQDQAAHAAVVNRRRGVKRGDIVLGNEVRDPRVRHEGTTGITASPGTGFLHCVNRCFGSRRFLELFAGTCRMSSAVMDEGFQAESFEVDRNPCEDVFSSANTTSIKRRIDQRLFFAIWMGLTCGSWSRARRSGPGQEHLPPPLRGDSESEIWGLPGLSVADQRRVELGNKTAIWCAEIFLMAANAGIPVVIENPLNSRLWISPPFRKLCQHFPQFVFDQCQYDLPWQKSTRLLAANVDLRPAMKTCSGNRVCSASGAPHVPLKGLKNGVFMTAMASPYPHALCKSVAQVLIQHPLARSD